VSGGQSISNLPKQVQAFNPLTANGFVVGSFSSAEAAAIGFISPANGPQVDVSTESPILNQVSNAVEQPEASDEVASSQTELPPISGSGEVFDERGDKALGIEKAQSALIKQAQEDNNASNDRLQESREEAAKDLNLQGQIAADQGIQESAEAQIEEEVTQENLNQPGASRETNAQGEPLTIDEQKELESLKRRDQQVRQHEQAHATAGGQHVRGGVKLSYSTGPDGRRYATNGEVNIDIGRESDPRATISKMRQVRSAALAPADPSAADRAAAATAANREQEARAQLAAEQKAELDQRASEARSSAKEFKEIEGTEGAQSTEGAKSTESVAGAQGVAPEVKRPSGIENRNLRTHESYPLSSGLESYPLSSGFESYPLSSPDAAPPVTGATSTPVTPDLSAPEKSVSLESNPSGYNEALDKALSSFE
jgi:hypothetical protein